METLAVHQQSELRNQSSVASNNETESFVRIEDKYLVPKTYLPNLLALLNQHLDPSFMDEGVRFNMIESLYFDSPSLKVFRDHFKNGISRFKLRLRQYGPNGKFAPDTEPVHLEMKQKSDGICSKFRFKVGGEARQALLAGETLPADFADQKKKKELMTERCSQVNSAISDFGLRPQARVTYERQAYERNGLRVTIDDNVRTELLCPLDPPVVEELANSPEIERAKEMICQYSDKVLIVEVKHSGHIPEWLQNFFVSSHTSQASFSKYAYSIGKQILNCDNR